MHDSLNNLLYRLFSAIALLLLLVALVDRFIRLFGFTLSWINYTPGRILEFSAMFMILAIAFTLRQIQEKLNNK